MIDFETAFNALGGREFNEKYCACDHDVGMAPCQYCAIHEALSAAHKEFNKTKEKIFTIERKNKELLEEIEKLKREMSEMDKYICELME
jgi:septal ring factor EnvC (AmiA/AmiB activator)